MGKVKIFIVEDNAIFMKSLSTLLKSRTSYKIVGKANTGEDAIESIKKKKPDIVLMDISMPGMGGIPSTYKVKKMENPPIVILMSLYDTMEYRKIASALKAEAFICKTEISDNLIPLIQELTTGIEKNNSKRFWKRKYTKSYF